MPAQAGIHDFFIASTYQNKSKKDLSADYAD